MASKELNGSGRGQPEGLGGPQHPALGQSSTLSFLVLYLSFSGLTDFIFPEMKEAHTFSLQKSHFMTFFSFVILTPSPVNNLTYSTAQKVPKGIS